MKRTKASPTLNFTVSCSAWLGRFIAEYAPYPQVFLDDAKENYVVPEEFYFSYVQAAYADLKVPYDDK